ncbi:hypothetical protein B7C42_00248 [Nocardia cerradoensis]|uniref:PNPLA domain-containing protein n=2 Tax=Nocardiaceae TaxID=85025 RepID=A0A231HEC4_9NOCA|nr:hypothetical protein B7C42_00248 [Nocardia cerradoensis]
MWAYGPENYAEFDDSVVNLLRTGLQAELVWRTFGPHSVSRNGVSLAKALTGKSQRVHNRTDSLVEALSHREFGKKNLSEVTHDRLSTVISATDLATSSAIRFGSNVSSCAPYGRITDKIAVAEAAAASAAFPALLPAITRTYNFKYRDGSPHEKTVTMTDGGVYDNLGLSPLLPGRSHQHTSHVYELDYLIVSDAGRGTSHRVAASFMLRRLAQSFDITHRKTQDAARSRIHLTGEARQVSGFVHSYLGMNDSNLPLPVSDLIPRSSVNDYPTNFAKMASQDLAKLSTRGEQLTRSLLSFYCPNLPN